MTGKSYWGLFPGNTGILTGSKALKQRNSIKYKTPDVH